MSWRAGRKSMYRAYLKYLFRERRAILCFLPVVYIAIVLTAAFTWRSGEPGADLAKGAMAALDTAFVLSLGMTYVLPVLTFAFVHRRRSADVFFALPIGRGKQLAAGLTFCFTVPFACYAFISAAILLLGGQTVRALVCLPYTALVLVAMTVIHTCLFLIANNVFDGIVMVLAYSCLPILVWVCAGLWTSVMVAGKVMGMADGVLEYLSPVMTAITAFLWYTAEGTPIQAARALLPAAWAVPAALLLKRHFVSRATERAGQVSDDPLAYPLVIHLCVFFALATVSAFAVYDTLQSVLIWYVLLFAAYAASMFVYRRSLRVDWRAFAMFGGMTALSFLIAWAGWRTHGFGLADRGPEKAGDLLVYEYHLDLRGDRLDEPCEADDLYTSDELSSIRHVSFCLEIPWEEIERYGEAAGILERLRRREIDAYYEGRKERYSMLLGVYSAERAIRTEPADPGRKILDESDYAAWAGRNGVLTEEELMTISRYTDVRVLAPYATGDFAEDGLPLGDYLDLRERGLLPVSPAEDPF